MHNRICQMGGPYPYSARITNLDINKSYKYKSIILLELTISYPKVEVLNKVQAQIPINSYYKQEVKKFINFAEHDLLTMVRDAYPNPTETTPSLPYEAIMNYNVTLNSYCTLSTYSDQFTYSGGAHGSTSRTSVSWNLKTGARLTLKDLLPQKEDRVNYIINHLIQVADAQMQRQPIYFPDYKSLIQKTFKPDHFYLSPKTITFYFQEYEIAPYAGGIMEFHIPYEDLNMNPPSCV